MSLLAPYSPPRVTGETQRVDCCNEQDASSQYQTKTTRVHINSLVDAPQDINIQNMNIELVAQMFKNYQSNVLFHLEGKYLRTEEGRKARGHLLMLWDELIATDNLKDPA